MKFNEIVNLDGREFYVSGSYEQKKQIADCHVECLNGRSVYEQDIFDYITTPSLVHVAEVFEFNERDEQIAVDLDTIDISFIRNIVANQLNNGEL
jgi:hypothetical protein